MLPLYLKSSDGHVYGVTPDLMKCSSLGTFIFDDEGNFDYKGNTDHRSVVFNLPQVDSFALIKVYEWAFRHKDDPIILSNDDRFRHYYLKSWDLDFLDMNLFRSYEVWRAACLLHIDSLQHAVALTVDHRYGFRWMDI